MCFELLYDILRDFCLHEEISIFIGYTLLMHYVLLFWDFIASWICCKFEPKIVLLFWDFIAAWICCKFERMIVSDP